MASNYDTWLPVQHLMALPVPILAPPPLAAEPDQASSQACEPLHMPALSTEAPLQPAKLAVWKLFMDQVRAPVHRCDFMSLVLRTHSGQDTLHADKLPSGTASRSPALLTLKAIVTPDKC